MLWWHKEYADRCSFTFEICIYFSRNEPIPEFILQSGWHSLSLTADWYLARRGVRPILNPRNDNDEPNVLRLRQWIQPSWWRYINLMQSKITGHSTVCLTAYEDPYQRNIKAVKKSASLARFEWNLPVTGELPTQRASNAEKAPLWWRHHKRCLRSMSKFIVIMKS